MGHRKKGHIVWSGRQRTGLKMQVALDRTDSKNKVEDYRKMGGEKTGIVGLGQESEWKCTVCIV